MPRRLRSSGAASADREGGALVAVAAAALVALWLANLAPPGRAWWPALLAGAAAAVVCGLRRWPAGVAWWALAGFCLGGLAGALAPCIPGAAGAENLPIRFVLTVRDGWQEGDQGWSTRVRLEGVEAAGHSLRCAGEVWATLAGVPALATLPAPGSRWEGSGELAYRDEWPLRRPQLRVKSLRLLRPLPGGSMIDRLREAGLQAMLRSAGVDPPLLRATGLAAALVLGRTERLPAGEVDDLRRSGLAHLLAVSGLNVGLVAAFVWWLLLLAGVPPGRRRWIVAATMLAFAALAGWGAPVRRAAFAGAGYLAARQLGRPLLSLPVVWAIVASLALLEPDAVLQAGFQLSGLVTLVLLRWVEPLSERLTVLPRWAASALAVAVIGQAASTPLAGQHFGTLSGLGIAANLLAAPVAFVLTVQSLVALGAAVISPWLGHAVLVLVAPFQRALDAISAATAVGVLEYPAMPAALLCLLAGLGLWSLARVRSAAVGAWASMALWLTWVAWPGPAAPSRIEVRMLPVREGMALLLRDADGAVLIDAGRSPVQASRALAGERLRRLDALVLTHPDADHTGGAARVLERFRVGNLVYPSRVADHPALLMLRRLAAARGVPEQAVSAGQRIVLAGKTFDVLWPDRSAAGGTNDASLVARVRLGGVSLLVTGDVERPGETALVSRYGRLEADILQLPHHGSATSSTAAFVAAVRPWLALAASGTAPRFRYPDADVVRRLLSVPAVVMAQRDGASAVDWPAGAVALRLDGDVILPMPRRRDD